MTANVRPEARSAFERRPMDYTRAELIHGGFVAWLTFMSLLLAAMVAGSLAAVAASPGTAIGTLAVVPLALVYGAAIGGVISLIVMFAGLPIAWLLGRLLSRIRFVVVHLVLYALLGALIGLLAVVVAEAASSGGAMLFSSPLPWVVCAICAASVMFGWWRASQNARWAVTEGRRRLQGRTV